MPPSTTFAPSSIAACTWAARPSAADAEHRGASLRSLDTLINRFKNSSYSESMMMNRLAPLQIWPLFSYRAFAPASTAASRSSVLMTMNASLPPSSHTTFFRAAPASWAIALPARSEPVRDTPRTRGSAMTLAICSLVAYTLTNAPFGKPASRKIRSIAADDLGHREACLRMMVLPSIRFGPANRAT